MSKLLDGKEFEGKIGTIGSYSGDLDDAGQFNAEADVTVLKHIKIALTVDADLMSVLKEEVLKLSFVQKAVGVLEKFTGIDIDGSDKKVAAEPKA